MYPGSASKKDFKPKSVTAITFIENEIMKAGSVLVPAVNITEFPTEYCIQIAVPGLKREDFSIELKQGVIAISAQRGVETSTCINDRCEYDFHDWTRAFILPDDTDAFLTSAIYKNGELFIRIPRSTVAENLAMTTVYVY